MLVSSVYRANMLRTHIQFEEETYQSLQGAATYSKTSSSELERQSVKQYLYENQRTVVWKKSLAFVGRFHSCCKDISEKHDQYLGDEW
jgi:hypothetical protein